MQINNTIPGIGCCWELEDSLEYLISYYYQINPGGGNLHNILEDGNLEEGDIVFAKKEAFESGDTLGMLICDIFSSMFHHNFIERANNGWKKSSHGE